MKLIMQKMKLGVSTSRTLILLALVLLSGCDMQTGEQIIAIEGSTMGTTFHIQLVEKKQSSEPEKLVSQVNARLESVNSLMSTWRENSEISRFNQSPEQTWFPLSADTYFVIELAQKISQQTQGAFDITVGPLVDLWGFGARASDDQIPDEAQIKQALAKTGYQHLRLNPKEHKIKKQIPLQINLSAIAKGFAVDRLAELLDAQGYTAYLVEIGGEIRVRGRKPDGSYWKLAIESPIPQARQAYQILTLTDEALATSGDYRNYFENQGQRYSHIIDPTTGKPITHNLESVTVISATTAQADALATALMVMGPERGYAFCEQQHIAAYFIYKHTNKLIHRSTSEVEKYLATN